MAGRRAGRRAAHGDAGDPRRGGGAVPGRPRGGALARGPAGWWPSSTCPCPARATARGDRRPRAGRPAPSRRWRRCGEARAAGRRAAGPVRGVWAWVSSWSSVDDLTLASPGQTVRALARQPLAAARQRLGHALRGAAGAGHLDRGGRGLRAGHAPLPRPARRRLPAAGGLPGRADRGAGPDLRAGLRLRHRAQAGHRRADLLLPHHRQRAGRAALGRPRAAQADALLRRLAPAHPAQRGAARRAAQLLQRPARGRHGVGDRRRVRRVGRGRPRPGPARADGQQPAGHAPRLRGHRAADADGRGAVRPRGLAERLACPWNRSPERTA